MDGGALEKIAQPIKYGAGAPLGSGKQMMSWIHIEDLAQLFVWAVQHDEIDGIYNAVAPEPVDNKTMTTQVAEAMRKPLLLPKVPGFVLKVALGEMAEIVLTGSAVSSSKVQNSGFSFKYPKLKSAVKSLLN
jgi:hypothetical protein